MKIKDMTVIIFSILYPVGWCDWFDNAKRSETYIYEKPNIIIISCADLGWDDISLHGNPLAVTPNIDTFARHGVTLNNHYINGYEFPTRVELFTGKYASRMGLQRDITTNVLPVSIPTDELTLPKILKKQGYNTHFLGKWGLGFHKKSALPLYQGFDSFYGSISFRPLDYYNLTSTDGNYTGYDLYNNTEITNNTDNVYSQTIFTDIATDIIYNSAKNTDKNPFFIFLSLQLPQSTDHINENSVPKNWYDNFEGIYTNNEHRIHAAMVTAMDVSIGRIMDALAASSILDSSVIIFLSESTSAACNTNQEGGCNFPLRGGRGTVWEGGIRSTALFYSSSMKTQGKVVDEMIHVTDWLPTLATMAKFDVSTLDDLNGVNIIGTLTDDKQTKRTFILHTIETPHGEASALRMHEYKLVIGQKLGSDSAWNKERIITKNQTDALLLPGFKPTYLKNYSSIVLCDSGYPHPFLNIHAPPCRPLYEPCLFNIEWDPCEYHNLASFMQRTVNFIMTKLTDIKKINSVKKANLLYPSIYSDPKLYGGVWRWWEDDINDTSSSLARNNVSSVMRLTNQMNGSLKVEKFELHHVEVAPGNAISSNITNPNQDLNKGGLNIPYNESEDIFFGIVDTHSHRNIKSDDQDNLTVTEIEDHWKLEHDTLDLGHFAHKMNRTKVKVVSNDKNISSEVLNATLQKEVSSFNYTTNVTNGTSKEHKIIEKTEILEVYETPTDSDVNIYTIDLNGSEKTLTPKTQTDVAGVKRTNLPENVVEYKFATSKGKTLITGSDSKMTQAFLQTKAIANNMYDQKSNRYAGEKQILSLDDENLRILSDSGTTTKIYSLVNQIIDKNESQRANNSVEEFFIDWNLLSRQSHVVTEQPDTTVHVTLPEIPPNLVTSEPLIPKSSVFESYIQNDNKLESSDNVLFQRSLKNKPETSTYVLAHSDADQNSAVNQQKLSYSSEKDGDNFLSTYKNAFPVITTPYFAPITPAPMAPIRNDRGEIHTAEDEKLSKNPITFEKNNQKIYFEPKSDYHSQNDDNPLPFTQGEGSKSFPFHGSIQLGSSHAYSFQGTAQDMSVEDVSSNNQNKIIVSNTNDDLSHFYGINILQSNPSQINTNKTEITESESNLKYAQNDTVVGNPATIYLSKTLSKLSESEDSKTRVVKSDIPISGIMGDEIGTTTPADDIFKIVSMVNPKNESSDTETVVKDFTSNTVNVTELSDKIPVIFPVKIEQNTTTEEVRPIIHENNINETRPFKKSYPRLKSSHNTGATTASTIVAVVLSAFVIIGMAMIAIVALISKNFGRIPEAKEAPVTSPPQTDILPKMAMSPTTGVSPTTGMSPRTGKSPDGSISPANEMSSRRIHRLNK